MDWFFRVEQFMRTNLGLKGSELYVYAVISGFTKSKQGKFSGSLKNLEDYTGFDKRQCFNAVNSLVEKGLLIKISIAGGLRKCEYIALQPETVSTPEKPKKQRKTAKKAVDDTNPLPEKENQSMSKIDALQGNLDLSGETTLQPENLPQTSQPENEVLTPVQMVWQAYKQAYIQRYGIEPLRNAKIFGQIKNFIAMVGEKDAPHIAAYYVGHNRAYYVQKAHDIGTLLMNAQVITKDYFTGSQTTGITAKWAEETETARSAAEQAKMLIRQSHFEKQQKTA